MCIVVALSSRQRHLHGWHMRGDECCGKTRKSRSGRTINSVTTTTTVQRWSVGDSNDGSGMGGPEHSTCSILDTSGSVVRYLKYLGKYRDTKHDDTAIAEITVRHRDKYRKYREMTISAARTTLLLATIINAVDVTVLQEAVAALVSLADEWQLSVSVTKDRTVEQFSINNTPLPIVTSYPDLGIRPTIGSRALSFKRPLKSLRVDVCGYVCPRI